MTPKYPTEAFYRAITLQSISSTQTCPFDIQVSELPLNSSGLLTIDPNTENEEMLYYSAKNSTTMKLTISKRGILPYALDLTTNGTDYNNLTYQFQHGTSSVIRGDVNNIHLNQILDPTGNTTFTGNNTFSGTNTFTNATVTNILGIPTFASTGARDTAIPSPSGKEICIVTGTGYQYYSGGAWNTLGVGTPTPDGSETVAGKWEGATVAEQGTATATGGTGASLIPMNKNLVKTTAGAADENKIPVLNANGTINSFVKTTGLTAATYSGLTTSDRYIIEQSGVQKYTTPAEFLQQIQTVMKASDTEFKTGTNTTKYITPAQSRLAMDIVAGTTYSAASIGTTRSETITYPSSPSGPHSGNTSGVVKQWTINASGGYKLTGTFTASQSGGQYYLNLYKNGTYVTAVASGTLGISLPVNFTYDITGVSGEVYDLRMESTITGTTSGTLSAAALKYDITYPMGSATSVTD